MVYGSLLHDDVDDADNSKERRTRMGARGGGSGRSFGFGFGFGFGRVQLQLRPMMMEKREVRYDWGRREGGGTGGLLYQAIGLQGQYWGKK